jgi:hypothetical protein
MCTLSVHIAATIDPTYSRKSNLLNHKHPILYSLTPDLITPHITMIEKNQFIHLLTIHTSKKLPRARRVATHTFPSCFDNRVR